MRPGERTRLLPRDPEDESGYHNDNVVSWDGPDDPENPQAWSAGKTWSHLAVVSMLTFLVPLGATMFAPAVQQVMDDFGAVSPVLPALVVSIYVLGWALGPLVLVPLSELYGRLPVYTWSGLLCTAAMLGCALSPRVGVLVALRLLSGSLGSAPLALGVATISDLVPVQRRGTALSLYTSGLVVSPAVAPMAGGFIADSLGWRWIFWLLGSAYGAATLAQMAVMRETHSATVLARRAARLRHETGNLMLRSQLDNKDQTAGQVLARATARPASMTAQSSISLITSLASAYVNGLVFLILTSAPLLFQSLYGFSAGEVGVSFAGYGLGNMAGLLAFGVTSDRFVRRRAAQGRLRPEDRLVPVLAAGPMLALGLLWYSWSAEAGAHWAVPVAGLSLVGAGNVLFSSAVLGYLVDAFTVHAASAVAANTVFRSIGGTLLPLGGRALYAELGWGWGGSLLALVAVGFVSTVAYFYVRGERIRSKYPLDL